MVHLGAGLVVRLHAGAAAVLAVSKTAAAVAGATGPRPEEQAPLAGDAPRSAAAGAPALDGPHRWRGADRAAAGWAVGRHGFLFVFFPFLGLEGGLFGCVVCVYRMMECSCVVLLGCMLRSAGRSREEKRREKDGELCCCLSEARPVDTRLERAHFIPCRAHQLPPFPSPS